MFEGEVHVRPRLVRQPGATDVADDTDNLGRVRAKADAHPDRVLAPEELPLDGCADDHDRCRRRSVSRVEEAAVAQGNAERAEVVAGGKLPPHVRRTFAGRHGPVGALERHRPVVAGEWGDDGRADVDESLESAASAGSARS